MDLICIMAAILFRGQCVETCPNCYQRCQWRLFNLIMLIDPYANFYMLYTEDVMFTISYIVYIVVCYMYVENDSQKESWYKSAW